MDDSSKAKAVAGGAVLGAMVTGIAALFAAASGASSGHFEAVGLALLAAAVAFAGVANAVFRH